MRNYGGMGLVPSTLAAEPIASPIASRRGEPPPDKKTAPISEGGQVWEVLAGLRQHWQQIEKPEQLAASQ